MAHKEPLKKKPAPAKKAPREEIIDDEFDDEAPLERKTNDPALLKTLLDLERQIFQKAAKLKII